MEMEGLKFLTFSCSISTFKWGEIDLSKLPNLKEIQIIVDYEEDYLELFEIDENFIILNEPDCFESLYIECAGLDGATIILQNIL